MIHLTAGVQEQPAPDARTDEGLPRAELTAQASTYGEALSRLEAQVPEGWRMLFIRRD